MANAARSIIKAISLEIILGFITIRSFSDIHWAIVSWIVCRCGRHCLSLQVKAEIRGKVDQKIVAKLENASEVKHFFGFNDIDLGPVGDYRLRKSDGSVTR